MYREKTVGKKGLNLGVHHTSTKQMKKHLVIPTHCRSPLRRIDWSAVLKAALMSSSNITECSPASVCIKISFETLSTAVLILCSHKNQTGIYQRFCFCLGPVQVVYTLLLMYIQQLLGSKGSKLFKNNSRLNNSKLKIVRHTARAKKVIYRVCMFLRN